MDWKELLADTDWNIDDWKEAFVTAFYEELDDPILISNDEIADSAWARAWNSVEPEEWFQEDPRRAGEEWAKKCREEMEREAYQYAEPKTIKGTHCTIYLPESTKDYRCLYPRQCDYQPAIIDIDFEQKTVCATFNAASDCVPESVYYGRREYIGFDYQIDLMNLRDLMADMLPLFDVAIASYTTDIVNGNIRGHYDPIIRKKIKRALSKQCYSPENE